MNFDQETENESVKVSVKWDEMDVRWKAGTTMYAPIYAV